LGLGVLLSLALLVRWVVVRWMIKPKPASIVQGLPGGPAYPDPPGIVLHAFGESCRLQHGTVNAAWLEKSTLGIIPDGRPFMEGKTYHIGYHYVILTGWNH